MENVQDMHYALESKRGGYADSHLSPALLVQERDWLLNEAARQYVRDLAQPKVYDQIFVGFEGDTRTRDSLYPLVVDLKEEQPVTAHTDETVIYPLPLDFQYMIRIYAGVTKGSCQKDVRCYFAQLDDVHEEDPFTKSSFEWEEVNFNLTSEGVKLYTDGSFTINYVKPVYLKQVPAFYWADGVVGGEYIMPDGITVRTGTVECVLPKHTYDEIVERATILSLTDFRQKMRK